MTAALVAAVIAAALFALLRKSGRLLSVLLIFFSLGLLCYFYHYKSTVLEAEKYAGKTLKVTAEVMDYPDVYDDYCRLEVRVLSEHLPNFKAYLYDNEKACADAEPGDIVSLRAKISSADTLYGEKYDNYHSKGIYFKLSSKSAAQLEKSFDIFCLPQRVSHWLSGRIDKIFPDSTAVFMRSLMLGDKTDFYDDTELYVSLSRSGLMHIVAVSGMHISFLAALLHAVFGRSRRAALLCIAILWFFSFVTGAGPSVVRAAFMHSCLLMAPVLKRENDSLTSLSVILAIMLCANPFAAASISLQLSFAAMSGLVLFADRLYQQFAALFPKFAERNIGSKIIASLCCSFSVIIITMPLTALHFGNVQLLSPITNLISLWAVSICFCWGWISCVLSVIPVVGVISATLCSLLANYILFAAELVASLPFSVLYMQNKAAWIWLYGIYVLIGLCFFIKKLKLWLCLLLAFVFAGSAAAVIHGSAAYYNRHDTVNILDVGQGQCLTVLTESDSVVIDCGNINTIDDAGTKAAAHLYSRGRSTVDVLVLSHLHEDHAGGAEMLMEMIDVKKLILPADCDRGEPLYQEILDCAKRNGTEVVHVADDMSLELGGIRLKLIKSGFGEDENERCLISLVECNGREVLCMADAYYRMERRLVDEQDLSGVDVLIVSHHGSKYSSTDELLEEIGGGTAIISVGNNYYGHPANETLEALETYGYNVYRTDSLGDIEIRIGNNYGNNGKKSWEERSKTELPR